MVLLSFHAHAHAHAYVYAYLFTCSESIVHSRSFSLPSSLPPFRYDEWIEESRISGKLTAPFKGHRSMHSKVGLALVQGEKRLVWLSVAMD